MAGVTSKRQQPANQRRALIGATLVLAAGLWFAHRYQLTPVDDA